MVRAASLVFTAVLGTALACTDRSPTSADTLAARGTWGSSQASLSIADNGATLLIRASGNCYGAYSQIAQSIPAGQFILPGTFTQLIGAFPGKVETAAQFSGLVSGHEMSITITVATQEKSIGPFDLRFGVDTVWPACLYP